MLKEKSIHKWYLFRISLYFGNVEKEVSIIYNNRPYDWAKIGLPIGRPFSFTYLHPQPQQFFEYRKFHLPECLISSVIISNSISRCL